MTRLHKYQDLLVWQEAMRLVACVYRSTAVYPKDEVFGLRMQTRRAAVAVPSNIAEGYGRGSRGDYTRFLHISRGSLFEVETQVRIAQDLEFLKVAAAEEVLKQADHVGQLLQGLMKSLSRREDA
jgi:four helix bundle protein